MNKDDEAASRMENEGQYPEPIRQDKADPEEIKEVPADFEETKLSGDELAYQSQDDEIEE